MATRRKWNEVKSTVADAISTAYGEIQDLAAEIREVVDNASGTSRESTQRIQTLDESAGILEDIGEPEVDEELGKLEVIYHQMRQMSMRRPLSRHDRRDNIANILDSVIETITLEGEKRKVEEKDDNPYQEFIDELEQVKDNIDGCEFPGIYG